LSELGGGTEQHEDLRSWPKGGAGEAVSSRGDDKETQSQLQDKIFVLDMFM
jgi:hypothetical protein